MSAILMRPVDETGNDGGRPQPQHVKQRSAYQATCRDVKQRLCALYDEVFAHEGYGDIRVEIRILGRGMKEVVLHCGKQYRYVVPYRRAVINGDGPPAMSEEAPLAGQRERRFGGERRRQTVSRDFKLERRKSGDRRQSSLAEAP